MQQPLLGPFPIRKAPRNRQWLVKPLLAIICEAFPAFQPRKPPKKISHPEPEHTQLNKISQDFEILHDTFVPCTLFATETPSPKTTNTTATDKPKEPSISRRCGRGLSVPETIAFPVSRWATKMGHLGREDGSSRLFHGYVDPNSAANSTKICSIGFKTAKPPKPKGTLFEFSWPQSFKGCWILSGVHPNEAAAFWKADWQGKRNLNLLL